MLKLVTLSKRKPIGSIPSCLLNKKRAAIPIPSLSMDPVGNIVGGRSFWSWAWVRIRLL